MPAKKNLLIAALVVLVSALVWLIAHRPPRAVQPPAIASSPPLEKPAEVTAPSASPVIPTAPPLQPSPALPTGPLEPGAAERAATARMFAAHAPLRVPEVADPDSSANRRILQTMVMKALVQSASPTAPLAPTE